MHLKKLHLEFFRNYNSLDLEFSPGTTVLVGPNAKGKTNLLEAIFMLAVSKSFRARRQLEVINWDNRDYARVEALVDIANEEHKIELVLDNRAKFSKHAKFDGAKLSLSELIGNLRAVLFVPEDLNLISGSPALRRRYFDVALSQLDRKYIYALLQYDKILRSRNKLLQSIAAGHSKVTELAFWNKELASEAAYIIQKRIQTVKDWNTSISEVYDDFASATGFNFEVKYKACVSLDSTKTAAISKALEEKLAQNQERECVLGYTETGPHREDYAFYLNGRSLALYGSRGECRTAVLVLKLQELNYLKDQTGESPIFLLDDVFSELDKSRRKALLERISGGQTIITTTDSGYFKGMEDKLEVKDMAQVK